MIVTLQDVYDKKHIHTIKGVRVLTGWGLKEAKDFVDKVKGGEVVKGQPQRFVTTASRAQIAHELGGAALYTTETTATLQDHISFMENITDHSLTVAQLIAVLKASLPYAKEES